MGSGASQEAAKQAPTDQLLKSLESINADEVTGDELVYLIRKDRAPWTKSSPPVEDEEVKEEGKMSRGARHHHYMTWWCRTNKSWSLVLEESDQPPWPLTGGFKGAFKASKRAQWSLQNSRPLIARCPAGTTNPGGWVRAEHPLPRFGRHYWEIRYLRDDLLPGRSLKGTFMTGLFSHKRTKFDWNSGQATLSQVYHNPQT